MKIAIDWSKINTEEEFYEEFLLQVSAPEWHGRNLDALADSIITGDINGVEPPFTIHNLHTGSIPEALSEFQLKVLGIFSEAVAAKGAIKVVTE